MNNSEIKICQNCEQPFTIIPEDFIFYKKIDVPPPTFCPECRMQRRFAWRNERMLYRNVCRKTGKKLVTIFAPNSGVVVYDRDVWWSDSWDPLAYGQPYDFSKPFFIQWKELFLRTPQPAISNPRTVNCEYSQYTGEMKDAYLVSASWGGENLAYAARVHFCRDTFDVFAGSNLESCYEDVNVAKSTQVHFSQNCDGCMNSVLLYDCKGCTSCVGCVGLRNKSYYIFNQPFSKEVYRERVRSMRLDTHSGMEAAKKQLEIVKQDHIRKYANLIKCERVTGDNLQNVADCFYCFDISGDTRNCKFIQNGADRLTDSYDGYGVGASVDLLYESFDSGAGGSRQLFCMTVYSSYDATYSLNCHGCNNIFGCIGLRNKEYCILNMQYSKDEFEILRRKIVEHMSVVPYRDAYGRVYGYGEFFPSELSPFCYNETVAQDFLLITKEHSAKMGLRWRDRNLTEFKCTLAAIDLPDAIQDVPATITQEIICCPRCDCPYRIILKEYQFLTQAHLPLPRMCPECRHKARVESRNPLKLWHRGCMCGGAVSWNGIYKNTSAHFHGDKPCPNEFETSYSPDRPEIVYCEQCYQSEVV